MRGQRSRKPIGFRLRVVHSSQKTAYQAVNTTLIHRNWLLGYRIAREELQGEDRAKYGAEIIKKLSKELLVKYGKGYTKSNLYSFYSFYKTYPEIFRTVSGKSVLLLSWSHYATLLQVKDEKARKWYEKEAIEQTWSVRTLQRNISSQYYYRILKTQKKELVESEMKEVTASYKTDKIVSFLILFVLLTSFIILQYKVEKPDILNILCGIYNI